MESIIDESKDSSDSSLDQLDIDLKFVRITRERPNGFIEFDYAVGELEVFVELILPTDEFHQFCKNNKVRLIASDEGRPSQDEEWDWRLSDATKTPLKTIKR